MPQQCLLLGQNLALPEQSKTYNVLSGHILYPLGCRELSVVDEGVVSRQRCTSITLALAALFKCQLLLGNCGGHRAPALQSGLHHSFPAITTQQLTVRQYMPCKVATCKLPKGTQHTAACSKPMLGSPGRAPPIMGCALPPARTLTFELGRNTWIMDYGC